MQYACDIFLSVACPALQYFSTFYHKWYDFLKNNVEYKVFVLVSSTTFFWNISHSKKNRARCNHNLMFIGPCIIAIVDEWKTNFMSLAILFHLLCAQHVSDINISIFRSLRLCWWITTSVVLFSVRCMLELLLRLIFGGVRFAGWSCASHVHYVVISRVSRGGN